MSTESDADTTIRKQNEALSKIPLLLQVIDADPEIVIVLNSDRRIVFANRAAFKLPAAVRGSVLGMRWGDLLGCARAAKAAEGCGTTEACGVCGGMCAFLSAISGKAGTGEFRVAREGAEEAMDLRLWASPLEVEGEAFTILHAKDVSHEKRREVLERVFFHDILNSVGGILGCAKLAASAPPERKADYVERISSLARGMVEEIESHRDLVSMESNLYTVRKETVRSGEVLDFMAGLYREHDVAKGKSIVIAPDSSDLTFTTDPNLLRRVIGNMLKNALEAVGEGGTVTLGCARRNGSLRFWVHNPGVIPHPVQLQLFQRSFSTKGQGRGLGTYSMRLLSERYLGAKVSFETSQEKGTTFAADLPDSGSEA